jgi:hypothetical protein
MGDRTITNCVDRSNVPNITGSETRLLKNDCPGLIDIPLLTSCNIFAETMAIYATIGNTIHVKKYDKFR